MEIGEVSGAQKPAAGGRNRPKLSFPEDSEGPGAGDKGPGGVIKEDKTNVIYKGTSFIIISAS